LSRAFFEPRDFCYHGEARFSNMSKLQNFAYATPILLLYYLATLLLDRWTLREYFTQCGDVHICLHGTRVYFVTLTKKTRYAPGPVRSYIAYGCIKYAWPRE
jgi:hypothetical protein